LSTSRRRRPGGPGTDHGDVEALLHEIDEAIENLNLALA
jgi:hypothetical protein